MFIFILQSMYFFLPAYFANMAPIIFKKLNILNIPINENLFGSHKTWRGLIIAIIVGFMVFIIQKTVYNYGFVSLSLIDYSGFPIYYGALLGGGAILGDLLKSYYKRKQGIVPGESWIPFDQLDFVFGALIFSFYVYVPPVEVVVILIVVSPILHILTNLIGYYIGINKNKF